MGWDVFFGIASVLLTAVSTLFALSPPKLGGRAKLKTDMEIFALLTEDSPYKKYRTDVDREINLAFEEIYKKEGAVRSEITLRITGGLIATLFGWASYSVIFKDGSFEFSWWAILTGYWALGGLLVMISPNFSAVLKRHVTKKWKFRDNELPENHFRHPDN